MNYSLKKALLENVDPELENILNKAAENAAYDFAESFDFLEDEDKHQLYAEAASALRQTFQRNWHKFGY